MEPPLHVLGGVMSKKKDILDYIESYINEKEYSPTIREIAKAVGIHSTSAVSFHLQQLRKEGKIDYKEGVPRTITICSVSKGSTTKFDRLVTQLQAKDGPLHSRLKMATFLAQVQLSDTRDAMGWLEYLAKPAEKGEHR